MLLSASALWVLVGALVAGRADRRPGLAVAARAASGGVARRAGRSAWTLRSIARRGPRAATRRGRARAAAAGRIGGMRSAGRSRRGLRRCPAARSGSRSWRPSSSRSAASTSMSRAVARRSRTGGLAAARRAVARIVGRDPESLDEAGVCRAAIESCAENFSDGVVAPAFWFALLGLPGPARLQGDQHRRLDDRPRTPRYAAFGWAAARLDDLVNLVPAPPGRPADRARRAGRRRHDRRRRCRVMRRDARLHRSPNAGWPESGDGRRRSASRSPARAATASVVDDPFLNAGGRRDGDAGRHRAARCALFVARLRSCMRRSTPALAHRALTACAAIASDAGRCRDARSRWSASASSAASTSRLVGEPRRAAPKLREQGAAERIAGEEPVHIGARDPPVAPTRAVRPAVEIEHGRAQSGPSVRPRWIS